MNISFINIIHSLITWQSILFAIVLITPKYNKRKENRFLAAFLFVLGVHFIYNILLSNNLFVKTLSKYSCVYGFLYGPLLFLYIKYHLRKDFLLKSQDLVHFVPALLIIVSTVIGITICNSIAIMIIPAMLLYCLLGFLEIAKYEKVVFQISSNIQISEVRWIKTLLISMILVLILNILQMQMTEVTIVSITLQLEHFVQAGILLLVNLIIYQGLKNPLYFQKITEQDYKIIHQTKSIDKSSSFNKELHENLATKLESYMHEHKPYLNSELDLTTLAQSLKAHPKTLSLAINHILGCSFSEYINSHRIETAMKLLQNNSDDQLTIMEVMYDVGFNSRSVFNTMFKKKTGLTPSQYKIQFLK